MARKDEYIINGRKVRLLPRKDAAIDLSRLSEEQRNYLASVYRCHFCGKESPAAAWQDDCCPECGAKYDPIAAQDEDDG